MDTNDPTNPIAALQHLANLAAGDSGASGAAASVILFAWNGDWPLRDLMRLDPSNRKRAMTIIQTAFVGGWDGGQMVEKIVGWPLIESLVKETKLSFPKG